MVLFHSISLDCSWCLFLILGDRVVCLVVFCNAIYAQKYLQLLCFWEAKRGLLAVTRWRCVAKSSAHGKSQEKSWQRSRHDMSDKSQKVEQQSCAFHCKRKRVFKVFCAEKKVSNNFYDHSQVCEKHLLPFDIESCCMLFYIIVFLWYDIYIFIYIFVAGILWLSPFNFTKRFYRRQVQSTRPAFVEASARPEKTPWDPMVMVYSYQRYDWYGILYFCITLVPMQEIIAMIGEISGSITGDQEPLSFNKLYKHYECECDWVVQSIWINLIYQNLKTNFQYYISIVTSGAQEPGVSLLIILYPRGSNMDGWNFSSDSRSRTIPRSRRMPRRSQQNAGKFNVK